MSEDSFLDDFSGLEVWPVELLYDEDEPGRDPAVRWCPASEADAWAVVGLLWEPGFNQVVQVYGDLKEAISHAEHLAGKRQHLSVVTLGQPDADGG